VDGGGGGLALSPVSGLLARFRGRPAAPRGWVTPFVVTRDSAPWIVPLLSLYRDAGLEPKVILDDRSTDGTGDALARAGFAYRTATSTADRAEPMVAEMLRDHPAGWLLRMDDDEVPSRAMLDWLRGPPPADHRVTGFARRFYRRDAAGALHRGRWTPLRPLHRGTRHDWQYRLFRAERVTFTGAIHTPGFVVPEDRVQAPPNAFIAHFVWLLRTIGQRRAKIASYNRQQPSMGDFFRDMYVPEDAAPRHLAYWPCRTTEFNAIAAVMAAACGHGGRA
jgi:hypothetical protein